MFPTSGALVSSTIAMMAARLATLVSVTLALVWIPMSVQAETFSSGMSSARSVHIVISCLFRETVLLATTSALVWSQGVVEGKAKLMTMLLAFLRTAHFKEISFHVMI